MTQIHFQYKNSNDLFSISKRKQLNHVMPDNHFHNTYELYYLVEGQRRFFIKDRTIEIDAGDLVIIHPQVLHRTSNALQSEHEKIIVNFQERFVGSLQGDLFTSLHPFLRKEYLVISFLPKERLAIESSLHKIIEETKKKGHAYEAFVQALLIQLLISISRFLEENGIEPLEHPTPMHERISKVVQYMNENYHKNLSLQYVADLFYLSPYYLSRIFKEVTGFSFTEYLNSVRVKEAICLLQETPLKAYAVASKVGFGSITHFGRVFKEVTGQTPLYYRNKKEG